MGSNQKEQRRYVRIPVPLKRENSSFKVPNFIKEHKRFIKWYQAKLGISDYMLLWLCFLKGGIVFLIIHYCILQQ